VGLFSSLCVLRALRGEILPVIVEAAFYLDELTLRFVNARNYTVVDRSGTGSQKRLVVKAIDVLTSEILSMVSASL
jgi:hypothetical protein